MSSKPSIFIGSSSEAIRIAGQVQHDLSSIARPKLWSQGVFGLGWGTLETLIAEVAKHDFAILVLSPDDRTMSRDVEQNSPRDNVIFELGLFMGRLGRERTFVLYDKSANLKLMSDLAGITTASYDGEWAKDDLPAAIGAACHPIREAILKFGAMFHNKVDATHLVPTPASGSVPDGGHAISRSDWPSVPIVTADIEWTEEDLKRLEKGLANAHVALEVLDLASSTPGALVTFENACHNVGIEPVRGRRHIASMTQVVKRLNHASWPVTQVPPTPESKLGYVMTVEVAARWRNLRSSTAPKRYVEDFTHSAIQWANWEVLSAIEGVKSSPQGLRLVAVADQFATIRTREAVFPTSGDWACTIVFRFEEPRACGTSVKVTGDTCDILNIHLDNTSRHSIDFMERPVDCKIAHSKMIEVSIVHRSAKSIIYINKVTVHQHAGSISPRHIEFGNTVVCNQGWTDLLIYKVEVVG